MKVQIDLPIEQLRRTNYPSVADQLDMLWHAMDRNEIPCAEPFYSSIKAVKEKFKKPVVGGGNDAIG